MAFWLKLLSPEAPTLCRMALAYADLGLADLETAYIVMRRRVQAAVACVLCSLCAMLAALAWLIAATWDTPFRGAALGTVSISFVFAALAAGFSSGLWSRSQPDLFENVKAEWERDRVAIAQVLERAVEARE